MIPGTEVLAKKPGQPDRIFTVDETGEYAVRSFDTPKLNHVDGKQYHACEFIHIATGSAFILKPSPRSKHPNDMR